jgi:hypothetical protein
MAPSIALRVEPPRMDTAASVSALRAQVPAAPPVPDLQPVPLPAQLAPTVELQAPLSVPAPVAARDVPRVQAPALKVAEAQLQAVPVPAVDAVRVSARPAAVKITVPDATVEQRTPAITQVVAPPAAPPAAAVPAPPPPTPLPPPAAAPTPVPATAPATHETAQVERPTSAPAATEPDVSTAPDATPQGRDDAVLGSPAATATSTPSAAPSAASARAAGAPSNEATGDHEQGLGKLAGQTGGKQPGAAQGERSGAPGDYIQLKPRGDTEVMHRSTPNIGYKPTRFEGEWTPYGESSIDTALRRAVEKTTVEHTFHLPRGIRVKCAVKPLLPIALFGCANPDPPPAPVASKVYDRLHLAPANPVAAPTPVADTTPAPAPTLKLDNAAECATARLSGGPPPPDCADTTSPVAPVHTPASTSSSWVPASDQFH